MRVNWVIEFRDAGAWAVACKVVSAGKLYSVSRPVSGPWRSVSRLVRRDLRACRMHAVEAMANDKSHDWECGRCYWLLNGRPGEEIPEHARQCHFRTAHTDPKPSDLESQDWLRPGRP